MVKWVTERATERASSECSEARCIALHSRLVLTHRNTSDAVMGKHT